MLTIWGNKGRLCDGIARREFVKIGASAAGLMALPNLLRASADAAPARQPVLKPRAKSVIMVYLLGGPAQLDTYDLKPDAPAEYRGEFRPIPTNVGGLEICELFPRQAAMADRLVVIRSLSAATPNPHSDAEIMTGYTDGEAARGRHPCMGAVVSKLREQSATSVPHYVALRKLSFPTASPAPIWEFYRKPGLLGPSHQPFMPLGPSLATLELPASVDATRWASRRSLLADFDELHRRVDRTSASEGLGPMQRQAFDLIGSGRLRDALDLSREDPRLVERYSLSSGRPNYLFATGYKQGTQLLLARRLIEAGVGFVEVALGYWDTHGTGDGINFPKMRSLLCPTLDVSLSALLDDLHERGLDQDVIVMVMGEFGRTPRINKDAGRDHWLPAMSAVVSGGGFKTGQVIGSTDARGEYPKDRPYSIPQLLATVYRALGIDPAMTFIGPEGRPTRLLPDCEPIAELL